MADVRDVVVPLYERRGPNWKGLGTASIVAAEGRCAIALTARHVLNDLVDETSRTKPAYPKLSGVSAIVGSHEECFIAEVHEIQVSDFADIAFTVLLAPEGKSFGPRLSLDPSPIPPGASIAAVGYTGLPVKHSIDWQEEAFGVRLEFRLESREAEVVERRAGGSRRLKWPVFKVSTGFDSAMSGGPILELRGSEPVIRGVICSDMSIGEDLATGGGGEAWASEIWPILMMPYRFGLEFYEEGDEQIKIETILDLLREGLIIDRGDTTNNFVWSTGPGVARASWRGFPDVLEAPLG